MSIGIWEMLLIVFAAVCILGSEKTEKAARALGKGLGTLKAASAELREEMKDVMEPVREALESDREEKERKEEKV